MSAEERQFLENHANPVWRLRNLYHVKDASSGKAVKFVPRLEQEEILRAVYEKGERNILIPKARQLGMSTIIALIILDSLLFVGGTQAAIVDLTQPDATKKLRNKIVFGFEHLPEALRDEYEVLKSNDSMFSLRLRNHTGDPESEVQAGMNARGDTYQILHVSEWGRIQWNDPLRSLEILTGALPSAKSGVRFIETTWKGGKSGHLWNLMDAALRVRAEERTSEDWTVHFFPWWTDASYSLEGSLGQIPDDVVRYLDETEATISQRRGEPFVFSDGQRLWYYKVAWQKGLYRYEEFPSLLEECFRAPLEGTIYADLLDRLRVSGAMVSGGVDRSFLVHTSWDLGSPVNSVTWYFQLVGGEIRVIDIDCELDITPAERVVKMLNKGYLLGTHYLPHDAMATQRSGKTFFYELKELGLRSVRVVPKTMDIWLGINHLRSILPRFTFRIPECEKGLDALALYHQKRETSGGTALDVPVHDASSHYADALRVLAEADQAHMLSNSVAVSGGVNVGGNARQGNVRVITGYRGDVGEGRPKRSSILDVFFPQRRA